MELFDALMRWKIKAVNHCCERPDSRLHDLESDSEAVAACLLRLIASFFKPSASLSERIRLKNVEMDEAIGRGGVTAQSDKVTDEWGII